MHRTYTLHTDRDVSGANQEDASVSNFTPLGEATNAVVMRLSSKLPRLKVASPRTLGRGKDGDSL